MDDQRYTIPFIHHRLVRSRADGSQQVLLMVGQVVVTNEPATAENVAHAERKAQELRAEISSTLEHLVRELLEKGPR